MMLLMAIEMMLMVMMMMPCKLLTWHLVLTPFLSLFFEVALRDWTFWLLLLENTSYFTLSHKKTNSHLPQHKPNIFLDFPGCATGSSHNVILTDECVSSFLSTICRVTTQSGQFIEETIIGFSTNIIVVQFRQNIFVSTNNHSSACCQEVQRVDKHSARLSFLGLIEVSPFVFCLLSFVLLFCWQACSQALVFSVIDLVPLSTSPHPQVTIACLPEGRLLARQKLSKWPFPSEKVELDCSVRAGKQIGADSQKPSWPAGVP